VNRGLNKISGRGEKMEFLKSALGDELYAQVSEKLKDNKEIKLANLATGEYVGKDKFDSMSELNKTFKTQIDEANKQIESFKGMDIEGIKKTADEYKVKFETAETEYNNKMNKYLLDNAIKAKLTSEKAKDPVAVMAHLKLENIKLDGETLIGIDEQLKSLKENEQTAYHFGESEPTPSFTKSNNSNNSKTALDTTLRAAMGLPPTV
jgi:hypothetical protein